MSEIYYGDFYGFHTAPFHITPDASLLFLTATYEGAIGTIEYGITAGKGFIVVSGQVGVGKTTVLRLCLDRLESATTKIIYLFNAALTTAELYGTILDEFDPSLRVFMSPGDVLRALLRKLLEAHQAGIQVVLAVDEAQNMPEQTLESLRILSNLESTKTKLVQIILVGQPELDALLKRHSLRQLAQRVAVRARLKRLTLRQSCRYIQHRTESAGRSEPLFTKPALWYISIVAFGIPRTINICCDNALINGYGHSAKRISLGIAREACSSLEYRAPLGRAAAAAALGLVVLIGLIYGSAWLEPRGAPIAGPHSSRPANGTPASPVSPPSAAAPASSSAVTAPTTATPAPANAGDAPASAAVPAASAAPAPSPGVNSPSAAPPAPATGDTTASVSTESRPARVDPTSHAAGTTSGHALAGAPGAPTPLKWVVQNGDSVYGACLKTYGSCDRRTLRAVLADNPQIGSGAVLHRGEVLVMPESIGWLRAKPH